MTRPRRARIATFVALTMVGTSGPLASPAVGQDSPLARGRQALRTGAYSDAVRMLTAALEAGANDERVAAARGLARAHVATGRYEDALEALDRATASVPAAELARARGLVLAELGRDGEALDAFDVAIAAGASDALVARADRAALVWRRGDREAAYDAFDAFIDLYNEGRIRTAGELVAVGVALTHLGRRDPALFHDAVRAYDEALAVAAGASEPRLRMAELFLDRYDGGEAQRLLAEVLAVNPRDPEALRAMARAKRFEGSSESVELAKRAVAVNARSADGRALLALLKLELGDEAGAIAEATRALETHAQHREALAVRAAAHYLAGNRREYEADRRRALTADPLFAGLYVTAAELAVRRGRYQVAVELAEQAVALDSTAWDGWALLGMNQLRIGRAEARSSLERAFRGDPFNAWAMNTLELLDRLDAFETVRTERFELVLHPDEADLLAPYVASVAEEAYDALSARYRYRPETPVRVEIYPRHADFSVRTMGLAGLGALGVAFGNVLAMDSPGARDPGAFHWGSTLWHEIGHAVTLGLTDHRVPRWLTEGISVHEERRSRHGWGGVVPPTFLQAFDDDRLLPLRRIDAGFVRPAWPGQIAVSYQHASVIVAVIEEDHGIDGVRRLLAAYAEGRDTDAAFRQALGVGPDEVDRRFREYVKGRYTAGLRAVSGLEEGADHGPVLPVPGGGDPEAAARRGRMEPTDFRAQLAAGTALLRAGRADEAEPFLERARTLYPEYVGPGSPYELLAGLRLARGDRAGAAAELERLTALNESALEANLELAELLESLGDLEGAADALERAVLIHPYDPASHDRLAGLAARLDRPELEVRERAALLALGPVDRAGALYRLAVAHRRAGDREAARRAVLGALEIAPAFAEAQDLLLDLSGGRR